MSSHLIFLFKWHHCLMFYWLSSSTTPSFPCCSWERGISRLLMQNRWYPQRLLAPLCLVIKTQYIYDQCLLIASGCQGRCIDTGNLTAKVSAPRDAKDIDDSQTCDAPDSNLYSWRKYQILHDLTSAIHCDSTLATVFVTLCPVTQSCQKPSQHFLFPCL